MSPGVIFVLVFVARWLYRRVRHGDAGTRRRWQTPFSWWPLTAVLGWLVLITALVSARPSWIGSCFIVAPLFFPWAWTRYYLVPRGMIKAAYYGGRLSSFVWRSSPKTGGLIGALLARPHCSNITTEIDRWLRQQVDQEVAFTGPHVLAAALLSDLDGKYDVCRQQMRLMLHFHADTSPETGNRAARHWLALDAARRGAWHEILELDGGWGSYGGPVLSFLLAVARRLTGTGRPVSDWGLYLRWWLCGQKPLQRPLLDRALGVNSQSSDDVSRDHLEETEETPSPASSDHGRTETNRPPGRSPLETNSVANALAHHARLLQASAPSIDDLHTVDTLWAGALEDPSLHAHLEQRIRDLGARTSSSEILGQVQQELTASLQVVVENAPHLATSRPYFGDLGSQRLETLAEELDQATHLLLHRYQAEHALPPLQELGELCRILDLYEKLVRSGGHRAMALSTIDGVLWNWAAWLFNDRQQTPLARACFHWLLLEGQAVGDENLVANMQQNLNCGY